MTTTTYEIVIKGRASARLLQPLLDEFALDYSTDGVTRLTGKVLDSAHLHGIVAHLTAVNAELISIGPITTPINNPSTNNETSN